MLLELESEHSRLLRRNINVEDIPFENLSTNHRLVNRNRSLFSCTRLSHILPLILYPDDLSDPLSSTVDERILRLDDPIEHFDTDNGRIATPEHESLQQFDLSSSYEKVHLSLCTSKPLSLNPSSILLQYMVEDISLEDGNLR